MTATAIPPSYASAGAAPSHRAICERVLHAHGWRIIDSTAIASRVVDSIVGPKVAFVYLSDFASYSNLMLSAEYRSEGRNAVEACGALLPRDADAATVERLATDFAQRLAAAIDGTYGVRMQRLLGGQAA